MNLFQYILLPFGLSLKHKTLDSIFTGISYSVFSLWLITQVLSLLIDMTIKTTLLKLSSFTVGLIWVRIHIFLKQNSEDFYGMFDSILAFQRRKCPQTLKFNVSSVGFILCFMICYIITLVYVLLNLFINQLYAMYKLNFLLYHNIALSGFYIIYWIYVTQFIYFETNYRYFNVLCFSNNIIKKFMKFRPNVVIRYQIDEVIENFKINDNQFNQFVKPLKRYINLLALFVNISIIQLILLSIDFNIELIYLFFIFLFIILFNLYFISTQTVIHNKSKIQNILIKNITIWRNTPETNKQIIMVKTSGYNFTLPN